MRRWRSLVLVLVTGWLTGCVTSQPDPAVSRQDYPRPFLGPTGSDVVQLVVALLDRPLGDVVIDQTLWDLADEQVIAPENKALLEDNGFRVGQIGGMPPVELQELLTSERCNPTPRQIELHADHSTTVLLGPRLPHCRFDTEQDGRLAPVLMEEAQCSLLIEPALTPDGRTRLRFTPQIQHGGAQLRMQTPDEHSTVFMRLEQPTERYDQLSWEVTLAPNEYVLVGTSYRRPCTLGHQCFIRPEEARPVQRLLVIRTGRPDKEMPVDPPEEDENAASAAVPLALQTQYSAVRGASQR